jgi:hypothetical protein
VTLLVHLFVPLIPLEIVECLLHHVDAEHEHKWGDVGNQEAHSKERYQLGQGDQQEEHVEEELELIEQHDWNEGEDAVFLIVQLVTQIGSWLGPSMQPEGSLLLENALFV